MERWGDGGGEEGRGDGGGEEGRGDGGGDGDICGWYYFD